MDRFRDGRLVTGIGMAAAAGVDSGGGGAALSVSLTWTGGNLNVAGASGTSPSPNVLVAIASGGTPPYSDGMTLTSNPSGKLFITASPDGVHNTIGWSGFSVNEVEGFTAEYSVTDSVGTNKTSSDSGTIKRTS
jgi:hypothetical protein